MLAPAKKRRNGQHKKRQLVNGKRRKPATKKVVHTEREPWLLAAKSLLAKLIDEVHPGTKWDAVRVSCGWPSQGALGKGVGKVSRSIGECWSNRCSAGGKSEIFISPVLSEGPRVLDVLLHEMVHAAVGVEHQHGKPFKVVAEAVGLAGKMTATVAGPELLATLESILGRLGAYPHHKLDGTGETPRRPRKPGDEPWTNGRKKEGCRLLKVSCPQCGYIVRTTAKWLDVGVPVCCCGCVMQPPEDWQDGGDDD